MVFITKGLDLILLFNVKNSTHFKNKTKGPRVGVGVSRLQQEGLARGGAGRSGPGRGEPV